MPETAGAQALLQKLKAGKLTDKDGVIADSFTPRDVANKHWAGLSTSDEVRQAARLLVDYDWLRREVVEAPGRRDSERYHINPAVIGGAA